MTITLVYRYKVCGLPLGKGHSLADQHISGAHRYFNQLIEIERGFLLRRAETRRQLLPAVCLAEQRLANDKANLGRLLAAVKERNARERRKRSSQEEQAEIRTVRASIRDHYALRAQSIRDAENSSDYQNALTRLQDERAQAKRAAYAAAACGWGTRLKIAEAAEKASAGKSPEDLPRFRRWTGDGLLAVQLQKGLETERLLLGGDNRIQFQRGEGKKARVRLRVDSEPGTRRPVWLEFAIRYHRDLPPGGKVMWAVATRKSGAERRQKDGSWRPYEAWEIQFSIRLAEKSYTRPLANSGLCGVDLGWRVMEDGSLRVACWVGDDGREGDVRLPVKDLDRWRSADSLRAIRDGVFADTLATLQGWRDRLATVPEWLRDGTQALERWRNHARLTRLLERWQPTDGDAGILAILRHWRQREAHLAAYEDGVRRQAQNWRRHVYLTLAASLAAQYRTLAVEDCDWRKLMRLPPGESNEAVNTTARYWQRVAAVGLLRSCLKQSGAVVFFCKTSDTTRICHVCGSLEEWDQARDLRHCCVNGHEWDQDTNAAHNLLARGREMQAESTDPDQPEGMGDKELPHFGGQDAPREAQPARANGDKVGSGTGGGRWGRRKQAALARAATKEEAARECAPGGDRPSASG